LIFEKRDIILIVGISFFVIGLIPFIAGIYAVIIGILLYFGIKFYVRRKRRMIEEDVLKRMLEKEFAWNAVLKLLIKNAQIVILKTNNFKETQ